MTDRMPIHKLARSDLEKQIAKGNVVDATRALRQLDALDAAWEKNEKSKGKVLALTELQNKYTWMVEGRDF